MTPWLIITGFWIRWLDLLTINCNNSTISLQPWLPRTRPILILFYEWLHIYYWTTYIVSRRTHSAENTSVIVEKCLVPLHSNEHNTDHRKYRSCIVGLAFVGTCLPSRCLAIGICVTVRNILLHIGILPFSPFSQMWTGCGLLKVE
jgi:hypothetical protein